MADNPEEGDRIRPLPTEGAISACNIPHSSIALELFETTEISAELLQGGGISTQTVRHANLVAFTVLKIFAFRGRKERKDAHDLIYCIAHAPAGLDEVAEEFRSQLWGKYNDVVLAALSDLKKAFADDEKIEGYQKDGPTAVALFELGAGEGDGGLREARVQRQRDVAALITELLRKIG